MRWYFGGILCCAFGVIAAQMGCSREPLPPGVVAEAIEVEQRTPSETSPTGTRSVEAVASAAAPARPAEIPATADAAVQAVLAGLRQNRPDAIWDALPASYQRDLCDVIHLFAGRLNPEAWRWFLQIAKRGATVARALPKIYADLGNEDDLDEDASRKARACESVAVLLSRISTAGPAGLELLKTIDPGDLLRTEGRPLMASLCPPDDEAVRALLPYFWVTVTLKESTDDSAVVTMDVPMAAPGSETESIEFVRIEGKWVPRWLAEHWAGAIETAKQVVRENLPSETAGDNFGRTFQALAALDFACDTVLWGIEHGDAEREGLFPGCPSSGCELLMMLGYLLGGPPESDPDFHVKTKESLAKKGKTVVVYCYAPKELKWDNERLDYDVAKHLAHQLMHHKIKVIDPDLVAAWLDNHDKWNKVSEIGTAFKVDYVIHVDIGHYSLFEPRSSNLYRGHADMDVHVVRMDDNKQDGNMIYTTRVQSKFPTRGPVDQNSMSFEEFKKRYLSALTYQIGTLFFTTETGDDIPYGLPPE